MSLKSRNFLYFMLFIIISLKNIRNRPPDNGKGPNHKNDEDEDFERSFNHKDIHENKNHKPNEFNINNKLREINILKEKTKDISKNIDESKNKLQKYNLYYYIMVIINIIFATILLLFLFYKVLYQKKHKRILNTNYMNISIDNNDNKKDNKISITKSSFIIEGGNSLSKIDLSDDKGGNVAPVPIISNE